MAVLRKKNFNKARRYINLGTYSKKKLEKTKKKLTLNFEKQLDKSKENYKAMAMTTQKLQDQLDDLEKKFMDLEDTLNEITNEVVQTKDGRSYSSEIRTIYYQLLAENVPPKKVQKIIKIVLSTFKPNLDTSKLTLPKSSLAATMRSDEMPTISRVHHTISTAMGRHLIKKKFKACL